MLFLSDFDFHVILDCICFLKNCKGGYFLYPVINVFKAEVIDSFGRYQVFEDNDFRNGF